MELFRRSLSKRDGRNSGLRSISNGSIGDRKRKSSRPTSRDSTPAGSDGSDGQSRYSAHSDARVRLPGFSKQPVPRGAAAPVSIRADPKMHKRKKRGWECIDDSLSASLALKEGDKEATSTRLQERTWFSMRGFGQFEIEWGVGCYGGGFTECIRSIATDHAEDLRVRNVRCRITNRLAFGLSNLKCGSKKAGTEDERNVMLGDFTPVSNSVMEDYALPDTKSEPKPAPPHDVETFRRCVENQINVWFLFFGQEYRVGRADCLAALLGLREDIPELFTIPFVVSTWEDFTYDYIYKMFEGVRKLGQFCRPIDDVVEIRILSLNRHPDGGIIWQPPFSFDMTPSKGYWGRNIIPRLESGVGRQGYDGAMENAIGKVLGNPNGKGKGGHPNTTVGASSKDLFPLIEKLQKSEMNMALQNCPRKEKSCVALCLDFNAHDGCRRGNDCRFVTSTSAVKIPTGVLKRNASAEEGIGKGRRRSAIPRKLVRPYQTFVRRMQGWSVNKFCNRNDVHLIRRLVAKLIVLPRM